MKAQMRSLSANQSYHQFSCRSALLLAFSGVASTILFCSGFLIFSAAVIYSQTPTPFCAPTALSLPTSTGVATSGIATECRNTNSLTLSDGVNSPAPAATNTATDSAATTSSTPLASTPTSGATLSYQELVQTRSARETAIRVQYLVNLTATGISLIATRTQQAASRNATVVSIEANRTATSAAIFATRTAVQSRR